MSRYYWLIDLKVFLYVIKPEAPLRIYYTNDANDFSS